MDPVRFFYSTDGTDVHGPVTRDALRLLLQNQAIGPGSHICREGESEWRPLNPDEFQLAGARLKPYEPPPYAPPTLEALDAIHGPPETWEERSFIPGILKWVYIVIGIGVSFTIVAIGKSLLPDDQQNYFVYSGAFVLGFLLFWGAPSLITLVFKGPLGHVSRCIFGLAIAGLAAGGLLHYKPIILAREAAKPPPDLTAEVAPKPPPENSTNSAAANLALKDLPPIESQAIGNSPSALAARDMMVVMNQYFGKVKACNEAENACNFDVATITGPDDIAQRRDLLMKFREAQADVLTYLQNFDQHSRQAMAHDSFMPEFINDILAGDRKTGHVDQLVDLWKARIKLTDDYVARLDYLEKSYGSWNTKDGKVVFSDNDALVAYSGYMQALQNDVKAITDEQKLIAQ